MTTFFIFGNDLRIKDNPLLHGEVVPVYIQQKMNKNQFQFVIESLIDLDKEIRKRGGELYYFPSFSSFKKFAKSSIILKNFYPFTDYNVHEFKEVIEAQDSTLFDINEGKIYRKFTPFYDNVKNKKIPKPKNSNVKFIKLKIKKPIPKIEINPKIKEKGGRKEALKILRKKFKDYPLLRNDVCKDTTLLSAHIKYGTVSIREVYHFFKINKELLRQLFWREFYYRMFYHFDIKDLYNKSYPKSKSRSKLEKWKKGKTGQPLIDFGMQQMNETGWMHNRLRMNVANYLIKILKIDWREGEKYFREKLVDYDYANNNGGWIWALTYHRTLNPDIQQKKYSTIE